MKKSKIQTFVTILFSVTCVLLMTFFFLKTDLSKNSAFLTPWQAIGGCGAGGSGGGGGGIAKWVGRGVSGGLLNLQAMSSTTYGEDFHTTSFNARFSGKPNWRTEVGLAIPLLSKTGKVQPLTNQQPANHTTGGLGDLSLDFAYSFGEISQYSLNLSTTLPTGQYDIKRGRDGQEIYMPNSLQKGTGIYSPAIGLSYTKDSDNGMLMVDLTHSRPVAMRLFSGENEFLDEYGFRSFAEESNDRFYYRFKGYGENDLGDYFPPSTTLGVTWAYRGHESRVQSIGVNFSVPHGVAWIHSFSLGKYDPKPDPDFKTWSATFQYGYEFSNEVFPVYFAIQLPLSAKKGTLNSEDPYDDTPLSKWQTPEWGSFLQTGSIFLAFKSTFF